MKKLDSVFTVYTSLYLLIAVLLSSVQRLYQENSIPEALLLSVYAKKFKPARLSQPDQRRVPRSSAFTHEGMNNTSRFLPGFSILRHGI